jgi:hypothetical protein
MILAANPPIETMLEQLTADQKWQAFQFLWKEVVKDHQEEIEPPSWHEEILRERLEKTTVAKRSGTIWTRLSMTCAKSWHERHPRR